MTSRLNTSDKLPPRPREASRFAAWLNRSRASVSISGTEQHKFAMNVGGLAFSVLSLSQKIQNVQVSPFIKAVFSYN